MKHLKKFENYKINEEITGIGLLVGIGLSLIAPSLYQKAKQFWSSHLISDKYKPTGKKETVVCELPEEISQTAILTKDQRDRGEVKIDLVEYQDDFGNIYWGYDHLWSPEEFSDWNEYVQSCNLYTAIFKSEDYEKLKTFLKSSERYKPSPARFGSSRISTSIPKPTPIEMVFRKDLSTTEFGNV